VTGPEGARRGAASDAAWLGLCALVLRLWRAGAQSLWYDEGTSAALATRSAADILAAAAADIHPPLYYLLLATWTRALGDGVVALRGLSAVLGALGVAGIYVLARRLAGRGPAIATGLLAAASPLLVWYGQEARMYVLAAALTPWLAWLALRLLDGRDPPATRRARASGLVAATALAAAALYTHYLAGAAAVLAGNAVGLGALGARWRAATRGPDAAPAARNEATADAARWAIAQAAGALLFAPWMARVWPAVSGWPALGEAFGPGFILREGLSTYALGVSAPDAWRALWPAVALVAAVGASAGLARRPWRPAALVGLVLAAAPPALVWAASLRRPAWQPKFLVGGAVGFELLVALGILAPLALARRSALRTPARGDGSGDTGVHLGRGAGALAIGWAATLALLGLVAAPRLAVLRANLFDPAHQRDDYRGIAAEIAAAAGPDDAVVLTAPTQIEVFGYYDRGAHATYPLPETRPPDRAATEARLDAIGAAHGDLYAVLWATGEADPEAIVEGWLNAHRHKAYDRWYGNVRLALWAAERAPTREALAGPVRLGDAIELRSLRVGPLAAAPGDVLTLTAAWVAAAPPGPSDLSVFVHLLAPDGAVATQRDMRPAGGTAATSSWPAGGAPVVDRIALALPRDLAPGRYRLVLGLYDPATGARVRAVATGAPDPAVLPDGVWAGDVVVARR